MLADARVGTSGFSYREWVGTVYPAGLSQAEMIALYARQLSTVEIASSSHKMPSADALATWASVVPPAFEFALRFPPQLIRDLRAAKAVARSLAAFLEVAEELGEHLGPVLVQIPESLEEDRSALRELLQAVPNEIKLAIEFEHRSWLTSATMRVLSQREAALVLTDVGDGPPPLELTAGFTYVRIRREDDSPVWREWAEKLGMLTRRGIDVYAYLKHDRRGFSVERARRLSAVLRTEYQTGEYSLLT